MSKKVSYHNNSIIWNSGKETVEITGKGINRLNWNSIRAIFCFAFLEIGGGKKQLEKTLAVNNH